MWNQLSISTQTPSCHNFSRWTQINFKGPQVGILSLATVIVTIVIAYCDRHHCDVDNCHLSGPLETISSKCRPVMEPPPDCASISNRAMVTMSSMIFYTHNNGKNIGGTLGKEFFKTGNLIFCSLESHVSLTMQVSLECAAIFLSKRIIYLADYI